METSALSIQPPTLWTCSPTSTTRFSARTSVFKTHSATTGCSKGAQLDAPAASFCKSATSPEPHALTARTVRCRYLVPRHLRFHSAAASTSISVTVIQSLRLTASLTWPIGQSASIFVVLQLIAHGGLFMMTSAFFTPNVVDLVVALVVRIIVVLFSLIFRPVMCILMKTNPVALEILYTI